MPTVFTDADGSQCIGRNNKNTYNIQLKRKINDLNLTIAQLNYISNIGIVFSGICDFVCLCVFVM